MSMTTDLDREKAEARRQLAEDPDILAELDLKALKLQHAVAPAAVPQKDLIPLYVVNRTFTATPQTARLLQDIGGLPTLTKAVNRFYQRIFQDKHMDQFIRSHEDPHGQRLASW